MSARLELETQGGESRSTIIVRGDLDMDSSPRLLEAIRTALKRATDLDVELSRVDYVDSSGIAVLIQGYKLALRHAVAFALLDPSPQMMAVIRLSQLESFFAIKLSSGEAPGAAAAEGAG